MDIRRRCPTTLVCRVFPTSHNRQTEVCRWSLDIFSPESHQRSWWIVHTQPTKRAGHTRSQIPPTKLVDRSYGAYKKGGAHPGPKSHQRSWWIVHIRPTEGLAHAIRNPTKLR